jgi:hypothetical protein
MNIFGDKSGEEPGAQDSSLASLDAIDALYEQEMQSNLAALTEQRRKARSYQSAAAWAEYWPFAIGIALSCFVPQMRELIETFRPWGMWILFPFASIANRPELAMGTQVITNMPLFFMYAQFPIEGIMARFALRGQVTLLRVAGQVIVLHLFALVELWLVNHP